MSKSLFRYIWRHSKRDQLIIFAVVLISLPFYYVSLDLPKKIVNEAIQGRAFENGQLTARFLDIQWPRWLGGSHEPIFAGFEVGRLALLLDLSVLFLVFVLINGLFKYWINLAKGALGERMMRRLRFELFSYALRFTPEAMRNVRSAEAATIIKDEVEPIGGFIGDAFIQPVLLGTQAFTALLFILLQSVWLGLLAGGVVGIQFIVIPRMRRELLRLGRMRQIASRRLAGRIGEVVDGNEAIHVHDTARWERAEVGGRLHELFDIRYRIYKRKFIVKFLNNLLAQMTPFFFYAVGGYFALNGRLDIGQLVAVIAAYRELPPPLKELIDWDQQRLDVQVKYDQVVGYFAPDRLMAEAGEGEESDAPLAGPIKIADLRVSEAHGNPILEGGSAEIELPTRLAIVSDGSVAATTLARILAHLPETYAGKVTIGDHDLAEATSGWASRRIAYAGLEPVLFPGTLRDNLLYGLRHHQVCEVEGSSDETLRLQEAKRTGNPTDSAAASWIDYEAEGYEDAAALDEALVELLRKIGLEEEVYRFGLNGMIDPERQPRLGERLVEARERLRERLEQGGMADLIEPFDPERYNNQATVVENLLFGVPTAKGLIGRAIVENTTFRDVLDKAKLTDEILAMGIRIAETMTEIFQGIPAGHPLFDQFSFVHADELGEFGEIVKRSGVKGRGGLTKDDRQRLLGLPLAYIEPRHRLGLLTDELRDRLLATRKELRKELEKGGDPGVAFYETDELNPAAPVRDNLLFGRVNDTMADARERIRQEGAAVIDEMEMTDEIERVGLEHEVGPAGRLLTATQRSSVNLIRCLIKRPDLFVVDGALAPFGERRAETMLGFIIEAMDGRTVAAVLPNERNIGLFDQAIRFEDKRIVLGPASEGAAPTAASSDEPAPAEAGSGQPDTAEPEPEPEPEPEARPHADREPSDERPDGGPPTDELVPDAGPPPTGREPDRAPRNDDRRARKPAEAAE